MVELGTNPLKLDNFAAFLESGGLTNLSQSMNDKYRKYNDNFNKIVFYFKNQQWNQMMSKLSLEEELTTDKKFETLFNKGFKEFEEFYLYLQLTLRIAIK